MKKTNKQLFEQKVREVMVEMGVLKEATVRTDVVAKYMTVCFDKIAQSSNIDTNNPTESIKLAETMIDYLNKTHVRYKGVVDKHVK